MEKGEHFIRCLRVGRDTFWLKEVLGHFHTFAQKNRIWNVYLGWVNGHILWVGGSGWRYILVR